MVFALALIVNPEWDFKACQRQSNKGTLIIKLSVFCVLHFAARTGQISLNKGLHKTGVT